MRSFFFAALTLSRAAARAWFEAASARAFLAFFSFALAFVTRCFAESHAWSSLTVAGGSPTGGFAGGSVDGGVGLAGVGSVGVGSVGVGSTTGSGPSLSIVSQPVV